MHNIIRELSEITAAPTVHGVGLKKVLLYSNETVSAITQIAGTEHSLKILIDIKFITIGVAYDK